MMSVLVEFAMFPTDKGDSISEYVSRIIRMMDGSNTPYKLTSMGTIFEVETLEEAFDIINGAYKQLESDCNRVYSTIKLDIRKGKSGRIIQKVESVERKLGKKVNS
jgi:uncharacterized protein (TIGR00106 family)